MFSVSANWMTLNQRSSTNDTPPFCLPQVTAALDATASSDPDVLFARKEELLADARRMSFAACVEVVAGLAASLTIVGAIVGVPAIRRGLARRKAIAASVEAVESGYSAYLVKIADKPKISVRFK
jgi:hypothetical protein